MSYNSESIFQRLKMLAGLVLIWVTVGKHYVTCNNCLTGDTYPVVKDGKTITCWLCHPGTKFVADCPLNDTTAICTPCDTGTYDSCYNSSPFCAECTHVCPSRFELVLTCNATHDNKCECQDGMYRRDSYVCLTHTVCQPGEQIQRLGTNYTNTECVPCPRGTFSTTGNSSKCQKCRVCTGNQQEKPPCNGTRDAVCTDISGGTNYTNGTRDAVCTDISGALSGGAIAGIVIGLLVTALLVTGVSIWCYIRRRNRNTRQQQPAGELENVPDAVPYRVPDHTVPDHVSDAVYDDIKGSTPFSREHSQNSSTRTQESDTRTPPSEVVVNQSDSSAVSAESGTDMHTSDSEREKHTFETDRYGNGPTPGTSREGATSSDAGSNSDSDKLTQASGQGVDHLKNQVDQDVSANLRKQEVLRCRAEMCTDEMILWLKDKIPIKKMTFIFCRLLNNDAVDEQEVLNPKHIRLQVYTLLYKWRDELGLDATADKLVNALVEEGCEKVANEFKKKFKLHEN